MALKLSLISDVRDFLKGIGKVSDAMEDVADSLDDVGKDSQKLEDKVSDAFKGITKDADAAGDKIGKSVKDGTRKAGEGFDELKGEANSTAKESAASFSGSFDDIADVAQEVAANAFAGFGPAGAAAGLAAAAGIGILISSLQGAADKANENKENIIALAQSIRDNGGKLSVQAAIESMQDYGDTITDTKEWWEIFQTDTVSGWDEMRKQAEITGLSMAEIFEGRFAGSTANAERALGQVKDRLTEYQEELRATEYANTGYVGSERVSTDALKEKVKVTEETKTAIENHVKELRAAEEIERARRSAIEGTTEATLEDVDAIRTRNGLIQDGITSELDYMDAVAASAEGWKEHGRTLNVNTEDGRANIRMMLDQSNAAADMAQDNLAAGDAAADVATKYEAQREAMMKQIDTVTHSRAATEKLMEAYGLMPKEILTEIKSSGAAETKKEVEDLPDTKPVAVKVDDEGTTQAVQERVNAVQGRDLVKVDVDDDYTVKAVQDRINGIRGRDLVKIDVDDDYTVKAVQDRIDGIKGRDVYVNLRVGNEWEFSQTMARLTATRDQYVNVIPRGGVGTDD